MDQVQPGTSGSAAPQPGGGFSIAVDSFQVRDHETLNRQLIAEIAEWRARDPGKQASNQLGWHSGNDLFRQTGQGFRALINHLGNSLSHAVRRYWPEFDPAIHRTSADGWVNVNGKGAFNSPHSHGEYHLSGCYYVAVPADDAAPSGAIEFFNPMAMSMAASTFGRRMVRDKLRIQPMPGLLLLFPSYLEHWVYPNQSDEERISIAFNFRILDPV